VGVLGSLVATVPLAWTVGAVGWRGALAIVGGLTLGAAALCAWLVRDRPAGPGLPAAGRPGLGEVVAGMGRVLLNPYTWPPFLAFFCIYAAAGNQMLWLVPYLRDVYGLPTTTAASHAMATALALLVAGPATGFVSDRVARRRKLPYVVLNLASFGLWTVFIATLGRLPLPSLFGLLFLMGVAGGAFVLTWPMGREVNPPELAGVAVAVVNLGGFLGAALTQGLLGAVLDAHWTGTVAAGARVYPIEAYRAAFGACALFALGAALCSLLVRETHGRNVYAELSARRRRPPPAA
jgi:sugar phosphate permease